MGKEVETIAIGDFILERLKEIGCDHLFGVPGDFNLGFFNRILKSKVSYVGTCNELNAAYAADAYARVKGISALSTTYNVGELSAINGVAGSFAESVPVIKITGIPATRYFVDQPLLHHTLGDYTIPFKIYEHVTVAQAVLDKPERAVKDVDYVLSACLTRKRPVYIALPADMVLQQIPKPPPFVMPKPQASDPNALDEAILETLNCLHHSRKPIFIPGVELIREHLQGDFIKLLEASGIPYVTMMLSKAMLDEHHPQFIGLYSGNRSRKYVQERVETSDCVVIFGERLTDFNTGGFSANLDRRSTIEVSADAVRVMYHVYNNVFIGDFLRELTKRVPHRDSAKLDVMPATSGCTHRHTIAFKAEPSQKLTMKRFFDRVATWLKPNAIVLAETGASLFSAAEVLMPEDTKFIGQTFYGSIGYTVGATLGACIAAPERNVYLFIGDGSLQVTGQDVSTMIRYKCRPTIFLINNDGYTIERVIVDREYNDIQPWKYHKLLDVFGGGSTWDCFNEGDLEAALSGVEKDKGNVRMIEVHLDRWDCNEALRRAGRSMAEVNKLLEDGETTASSTPVDQKSVDLMASDVPPPSEAAKSKATRIAG